MKLSIITVNHNNLLLTQQTVDSILMSEGSPSYEIIVVDNSSNLEERYKGTKGRIKAIFCQNKGFGNACNIGFAEAEGELILFLNSDTILEKDTLSKSYEFIMFNNDIGVVGIKTLLRNGELDKGCKRGFPTPAASFFYFCGLDRIFPKSRKFGAYHQTYIPEDQTSEVDCISGAFMLMKKETFLDVGGFDEEFFMHGEDIDFCYRGKEKGYKTIYFAGASMVHLKGQSSGETSSKMVLKSLYKSMWRFYRKHYYEKKHFLVSLIVFCGIKAKYFISEIRRRWKSW